jgi:hypothetical protein
VKLGHVALDGTRIKANASKHKAMSYDRMKKREAELEAEVDRWLKAAEAADAEEAKPYGDQRGDEIREKGFKCRLADRQDEHQAQARRLPKSLPLAQADRRTRVRTDQTGKRVQAIPAARHRQSEGRMDPDLHSHNLVKLARAA